MKIHQQLNSHLDMNKQVHIDKADIEKEELEQIAFSKSPKENPKRQITINNCIFEMKKGETEEQAIKRLTNTFKNSTL